MASLTGIPSAKRFKPDPLLSHAREQLCQRLSTAWRPGERLPSIRTLSADLQVSHGTVQRAVQEMVRLGVLVSRPRSGIYVSKHFTPMQLQSAIQQMASAQQPQPLAGRAVGVVCVEETTHMDAAIQSAMASLQLAGATVQRLGYSGIKDSATILPLDDILLVNPDSSWFFDYAPHQHLVVVTTASTTPQLPRRTFDMVTVDQEQGAALAGEHLRRLGCRNVCFMGTSEHLVNLGPPYRPTSAARLRGFQSGWGDVIPQSHQLYAGAYSPLGGARSARFFVALDPRPDGVFVACDEMGVGLISGLSALGLEVARDYQLVGFDGHPSLKALCPSNVASVIPPAFAMGTLGADMLISRVREPGLPARRLLVGCTLSE